MSRSAVRPNGMAVFSGRVLGGLRTGLLKGAHVLRTNPGVSLGTAAFGLFFIWVSGNALFAQSEHHHSPLIVTRGMPGPSLDAATNEADPLLAELQQALARTGHYNRSIDGRFGPGTRAAIERFQRENGLSVDGRPSPDLLREVKAVGAYAAPRPSSKPTDWTDAEEFEIAETPDGRSSRVIQDVDQVSSIIELERAEALNEEDLVRKIQTGLTAINLATLEADGIPGARTKAAIREFEQVEGLDVTGEPDLDLLQRLVQVGAFSG
ncbi:peptidoglycan-binding domain-containing protein [Fulvimarina sp. MAC8]|uniref:peptidoglycan-binding domain-containing protein n=1 Tax=Fulvimarina sp. MAC8 TaxID=3162874 RepID=UPI0032EDEC41